MTTRQRRGTGSITKRARRPGSPWVGRIAINGRRIAVYGRTKAEAEVKLDAAKLRAKTGLVPTDARLTVARYLERWLDRDREVRERTISRYHSLIRIHVVPVIGTVKLSELQPDDVRRVLAKMKLARLSPTTRSHVRTVLRLALSEAESDGLVIRNVARLVKLSAPKATKARALSDAEIRAILAAVEGDRLKPVYTFAMATGARLGEILGLRWRDVDRERGELRFTQTVGRLDGRDLWDATKNESSDRTFPLTAGVRSALATQKAMQDAGLTGAPPSLLIVDGVARGPLVFTSTNGGALNGSYVTHHFQRLLTAAGIEPLRLHDLRHGFVSALFADGVSLEEDLRARRA